MIQIFLTILCLTKPLSLFKSTGTGINLSIPNLLNSVFKPAKCDFSAKLEVSILLTFFNSDFIA